MFMVKKMKMMIKLGLLLLVLLLPTVIAEVERSEVFILNFNYDNGIITYKDRIIKCGYAPDRLIQPEEEYMAEMISLDDEVLYSFKFKIPLTFNVDMSDPLLKSLSGGMIVLNETDFALIFPYYDDVKSIVIYNPRDYVVAIIPMIDEQFIQRKSSILWISLVLILILISGYLIYKHFKKPKEQSPQWAAPYYRQ